MFQRILIRRLTHYLSFVIARAFKKVWQSVSAHMGLPVAGIWKLQHKRREHSVGLHLWQVFQGSDPVAQHTLVVRSSFFHQIRVMQRLYDFSRGNDDTDLASDPVNPASSFFLSGLSRAFTVF
jgi:hypothetical protein